MNKAKKVLLLGASGSIGRQTIDIINEANGKFELTSFSVGNQDDKVPGIIENFPSVKHIYLKNEEIAKKYAEKYPNIVFYSGNDGLLQLMDNADYDMCVDALVGFVGMEPAIKALQKDKILCLANKEALVSGGTIINDLLDNGHGKLYPIDSEHVALAKCLSKCNREDVKRIIITASGGALRDVPLKDLKNMKASDALKHPTWKMGQKITIDCATMMNKGFEIIEAYYLFGFSLENVSVLMHEESLIHSAVELNDGSYLLDYGKPDMHNPIRWALYEGNCDYEIMHVSSLGELKDCHFREYDPKRYPCTELAKLALEEGASKMIALNASNEVLVNKFLNGEIGYLDIAKNVKKVLKKTPLVTNPTLENIKEIDRISRKVVM